MDPGYRSPMIDFFRRGEAARDVRQLAAQGALSSAPIEQLALLILLTGDDDPAIAETADATLKALPEVAVRGLTAAPAADAGAPPAALVPDVDGDSDEDVEEVGSDATPTLLAGLPI